jgi:hypothetical protein
MYVAVFYRRRRRGAQCFPSFETAAHFLRDGCMHERLSPLAIWQADSNRLWLWSGRSRISLSRDRALRDTKTTLALPFYHLFGTLEEFDG